ncbi:DUF5753 domain-containing protein [Streptomyces sp. UNOB3_S3]|uniref:DUF5753 domain-containing protein n=1 Tax=Streptomyces sp. UNOB3_S3 TaxID=2871682 RepID=UPI001E5D7A6B|nr:DUF5753 domain-containing protein [Streptomyces sp. UNOB3_S3]MCC3779523.1 DUF5753 domain-containing protein [Streptomyces sp. UNOB3_S3]
MRLQASAWHHAVALRTVQIIHMPGLRQTEDYAKAVFATAVPRLTSTELRRRVAFRMRRREVLDRNPPLVCTFMIHEAAVRRQLGGAKVMARQLEHVLEESERENITVRAIPLAAGGFPTSGLSTVYAVGSVPQLDTVHLDVAEGSALVDAQAHVVSYRAILDETERYALSPDRTRDLVRKVIKET